MTVCTWEWSSPSSACFRSATANALVSYLKSRQIRVKVILDQVEAVLNTVREVLVQLAKLALRL